MALSNEQSELLKKIQEDNKANGATWIAGETSMLHLSESERIMMLGCVDDPNDIPLADRAEKAREGYEAYLAQIKTAGVDTTPTAFDWRNVGGQNFISPVKSQGHCGSCVAFGVAATVDAAMRIACNLPVNSPGGNTLQDLSEAQLFYCGGGICARGWHSSAALAYCQNTGLVPESSYPYTPGDQPCNLPVNWQSQITKITTNSYLTAIQAMKNWLAVSGTLITHFTVYKDFFAYKSGVYTWNGTSPFAGYHCVTVVGYDDTQQAWICKNSWGTGWGMSGYFMIGYGQCGIDASMWGVNSFTSVYPFPPASTTYTLSLDTTGTGTWSPHDPNDTAGWLDGDQLIINCAFNLTPVNLPPASAYIGLSVGAACNQDQNAVNALLSQAQSLANTPGMLLGTGITAGSASNTAIFYNAQSTSIPSIPLTPTSRGTLTNFIYQWTMTYNGNNTVLNTERQTALVFGYGYQLAGVMNNQ